MRTRATVEIIFFDDREARCDNTVITVAYYGLFNDVRCHKSNITSGEVFNGFDPVQTVDCRDNQNWGRRRGSIL